MRIISENKDYYDYLQSLGQDPNIVFKREIKIVNNTNFDRQDDNIFYHNVKKFIPKKFDRYRYRYSYEDKETYGLLILWMCGEIKSFVLDVKNLELNKEGFIFLRLENQEIIPFEIDKNLVGLYNRSTELNLSLPKILVGDIEYSSPIIAYLRTYGYQSEDIFIINPNLKDLGLSKFYQANEVFQKVSMWLSTNQQLPLPEMKPETEKEFVSRKGFDKKYSFRKRPKD